MPGTFTHLRVHFVWSTKSRKLWIDESIELRLHEVIGGILEKRKSKLLIAGGVTDHIHLLVGMHPTQSVSDLARDIKTNSSAWIHDEFPALREFGWQEGYGAFSVSKSLEEQVTRYILNQQEHHRRQTFQDELRELLTRHEIEYDERFLWD